MLAPQTNINPATPLPPIAQATDWRRQYLTLRTFACIHKVGATIIHRRRDLSNCRNNDRIRLIGKLAKNYLDSIKFIRFIKLPIVLANRLVEGNNNLERGNSQFACRCSVSSQYPTRRSASQTRSSSLSASSASVFFDDVGSLWVMTTL